MEGSRKAYVYKAKGSQCPVQNTALRGDFTLYTNGQSIEDEDHESCLQKETILVCVWEIVGEQIAKSGNIQGCNTAPMASIPIFCPFLPVC
jgi:hypothetical protein